MYWEATKGYFMGCLIHMQSAVTTLLVCFAQKDRSPTASLYDEVRVSGYVTPFARSLRYSLLRLYKKDVFFFCRSAKSGGLRWDLRAVFVIPGGKAIHPAMV